MKVPYYASKTMRFQTSDVQSLREAIEFADPHQHHEGQNECLRCEEPLLLAAARLLRELKAKRRTGTKEKPR
jgi:hypothetical protein